MVKLPEPLITDVAEAVTIPEVVADPTVTAPGVLTVIVIPAVKVTPGDVTLFKIKLPVIMPVLPVVPTASNASPIA